MKKRKIIAVVGLPGSGKSGAIKFLIDRFGWTKVYFGDVTFEEMKRRGLAINEKNEREVREGLREKFGQLVYAKRAIKKIEGLPSGKNVLVESLYSWPEYLEFKKKFGENFLVLAVYASPRRRHERLARRKTRPLTAKEAQSRDYSQIENLTQAGPIAMADFTVNNEGPKEGLIVEMEKIVKFLK